MGRRAHPHKRFVFFVITLYIHANTHPLLPSRSPTPFPLNTPPTFQPNTKMRPKHWDAFSCLATFIPPNPLARRVFVFMWFSSNPTPPSSQRRKHVPFGDAFSSLAAFRLPEHHQRAYLGTLLVLAGSPPLPPARDENVSCLGTRFRLWLHSFHQTPLTCPFGHVSGVRQVLQPETKTRPHVGRVFVSAYHYQHAHLGTLVFHSPLFLILPVLFSFLSCIVTILGNFLLCKLSYLNKYYFKKILHGALYLATAATQENSVFLCCQILL